MKSISCLNDLEKLNSGIILLTGEADALGYRILCDLTKAGVDLLHEVYGVATFGENWNHGSDDNPHIGSVMLSSRAYLDIAPIFLVKQCHTVFEVSGAVVGMEDGEEFRRGEFDWESGKYLSGDKIVLEAGPDGDQFEHPIGLWFGRNDGSGERKEHIDRLYTFIQQPRVGSRCVHAMTGRSE